MHIEEELIIIIYLNELILDLILLINQDWIRLDSDYIETRLDLT